MYRVYGKHKNDKRFSALGSFGDDGVCFVANLFYAFEFPKHEHAEKFMEYAKSQCSDYIFEIRKAR